MDTQGNRDIQDLAKRLGDVSKNTKSLASNFSQLKNAFLGWVGFLGVREIARFSDEMQNLANRLKIVGRANEDVQTTMRGILNLANETNQSVSEVGEVYTRLGTSLKAANASSEQLLAVSKALINSFRISGSTNNETSATIIQLSQAFASGTLRGQELRSVMLQNAELARLLRERFGKDLAKSAEAGLISIVEVLKILRDNMERINASAKILTPTFEQTITKAFNVARAAVSDLNQEFKLSEKFATFVDFAVKQIGTLIRAFIDLGKAIYEYVDFQTLGLAAFGALAIFSPLTASVVALGAAFVLTGTDVGSFIDMMRNLGAWLVQLRIWNEELQFSFDKGLAKVLSKFSTVSKETINDLALQLDLIKELKKTADELGTPKYSEMQSKIGSSPIADQKKAIDDLIAQYQKLGFSADGKLKKIKEILGDLNKEFLAGKIEVGEYNQKLVSFELYKLNRQFAEGKFNLFQYKEGLAELKKQNLAREFEQNRLSVWEFNMAVASLDMDVLTAKLEGGKITLQEFNVELAKITQTFSAGGALRAGTQSYLDQLGTTTQQVADAIRSTFVALEDSFLSFIKTGKFNFAEFTQQILDDLTKIIIRASVIKPLAEALLYGVGSSGAYNGATTDATGGGYGAVAAKGLAFDKGVKRFAKGGIVDSPTSFMYGAGKRGLMGEAGPEAVLPLQRGSGGSLGVAATVTPVNITIINQAGAEVSTTEKSGPGGERMIEVLIVGKVREGLASGVFDKAMQQSYGLNRKGS